MNQVEFMMFFLIGHFLSEFMFQTEHTITTKWKSTLEGYASCGAHTMTYTLVTSFFIFFFMHLPIDFIPIAMIFAWHFIVDKYMLSVHYLVLVKRILAPLTVKLAVDLANEPDQTQEQTVEYIEKWQNNLKLDEDTFLGSIFYVIEFYAVDHILHIVPTFFMMKYYFGF